VVADFMSDEHFAAHVRRMRSLYKGRRDVLLSSARRHLGSRIEFAGTCAGLRAAAYLKSGRDDETVSRRCAQAGLDVPPLSRYYAGKPRSGLLFGYAGIPPAEIEKGMETLGKIL